MWCKNDGEEEDRGMEILGLKETVVQMGKTNGVRMVWACVEEE